MNIDYISEITGVKISKVEKRWNFYYITYDVNINFSHKRRDYFKIVQGMSETHIKHKLKLYFPDFDFVLVPSLLNLPSTIKVKI